MNPGYCIKECDGTVVDEGALRAARSSLESWIGKWSHPCLVGLEATMFTGWVYDFLKGRGVEVLR